MIILLILMAFFFGVLVGGGRLEEEDYNMAELKPCECKSNVRICSQPTKEFGTIFWVHCDKCGNDSWCYETKQGAIDAWNRREK